MIDLQNDKKPFTKLLMLKWRCTMANLTRWNPRREMALNDPFRSIEQMFDEMWPSRWFGNGESSNVMLHPAMDVIENESDVTIRLDLPGMKTEDVNVELENGVLTVSGEIGDTIEKKDDRYHYRERSYGSFQRSVRLPNTLDYDKCDAHFENGVLTITLPKLPQAQPKQINIKTNKES